MTIIKAFKLTLIVSLVALLSACVTVTDSRFSKKVDHNKAAETYVALGIGYLDAGDLILARKKIERALTISPESASAHSAMAMYWLNRGEDKLAEQEFETAHDYDDEHSPTNYHYGRFLLSKKRDEDACDMISDAANDVDYGARVNAYEDLGICYLVFNESRESVDAFEKAWSLDMNSTIASLHLTQIYMQKKNTKVASRWFDRFEQTLKANKVPHSAASLFLGYQLSKAKRDRNGQHSYAFKLKKRFPKSDEYLSFKRGK